MDSKCFSRWLILYVLFVSILKSDVYGQNNEFVVTDYGANLDGKTDSNKAFLSAWTKACQTNGGKLSIPKGTYFLSGANFAGPCNGQTYVDIVGTLQASSDPSSLKQDYWIKFDSVDSLTISGNGIIDGSGSSAWGQSKCTDASSSCKQLPSSIKFNDVTNSVIQNINLVNSKMFHLNIYGSKQVVVNNVSVTALANSPNTDGIHIGNSDNIRITHSNIATGDDCISMVDGCTNINISYVSCGPGHGISIGSLGKYSRGKDVSGITVTNSIFTNTDNGLRIKTLAPSSPSIASSITFAHIVVNNVKNPIIINQRYCQDSSNCPNKGESNVLIKGVKFIDVKGSSATPVAVNVECSKSRPCQDIEISGIKITYKGKPTTATCSNCDVRFQGSPQVPSNCSS